MLKINSRQTKEKIRSFMEQLFDASSYDREGLNMKRLDFPRFIIVKITEGGECLETYAWSDDQKLIESLYLDLLKCYDKEIERGEVRYKMYENY